MHPVLRIDPDPDTLQDAVDEAMSRAAPGGRPLRAPGWGALEAKGRSAEGQAVRRLHLSGTHVIDLHAVWWTDAIRRKHWRITAEYGPTHRDPASTLGHPLAAFAPPLSCGQREHGGLVVQCRCGNVGSPAALGWMGETCGPCSDREQEGLPPLGPPRLRLALSESVGCLPLADGRVAVVRDTPSGNALAVWPSPDADAPTWQVPCEPDTTLLTTAGGLIALGDASEVVILSAEDGVEKGRLTDALLQGRRAASACFVGRGKRALVLGCGIIGPVLVRVPCDAGEPVELAGEDGPYFRVVGVAACPPGDHFLLAVTAGTDVGIQVRDAGTGAPAGVLRAGSGMPVQAPAALPDGSVLGWFADGDGVVLARWSPGAARVFGPADRVVPAGRPDSAAVAAPDGEIAAVEGGEIVARCARTLKRRAAFRPEGAELQGRIGFAGGWLFADTSVGPAVWPWRELMGR